MTEYRACSPCGERYNRTMFDIAIIAVGKMRDPAFRMAAEEYLRRLTPFAKVTVMEIEAVPFRAEGEKERAQRKEAERIRLHLEKARGKAAIFLLDERGGEYSSEEFARFLGNEKKEVIFVLGGALGFTKEMKKEFSSIALSRLTLPHELARVVLLEQVYRAAAILNGKTYHY